MSKQRKIKWFPFDLDNGTLTASVIDSGRLVMDVRTLAGTAIYDSLTPVGKWLLMHGTKQRVGDGAAGEHGPAAFKEMKSIWAALQRGDLAQKRAGGPRESSVESVAFAKMNSISVETAVERLGKLSKADMATLRKSPAFKLEKSRETTRRLEAELADAA